MARIQPRQAQLIGQQPQKLHHQLRLKAAWARTGLHQSASQIPRRPRALHPKPRPMPPLTKASRLQLVWLAAEVRQLGRSRLDASGVAGLENAAGLLRERLPRLQHTSQVCASSSPCVAHAPCLFCFDAHNWFQLILAVRVTFVLDCHVTLSTNVALTARAAFKR